MIVYVYTFPNGKKYVGQTIRTVAQRAERGAGYKGCPFVYAAIQKYGWDSIEIETIECNSEEEMDELERKLIAEYKTQDREFGYNIESGGHKNKHLSEETKQKMSEARKGQLLSEEAKRKLSEFHKGLSPSEKTREKLAKILGQPIICIENKKIYDSVGLAAKELEVDRSSIYAALNGKSITCLGFHWKWLKDYNENEPQNLEQYKCSEETKRKISEALGTKVICLETKEIYPSAQAASKAIGFSKGSVGKVLRGELKTAGGFHWMKLTDYENQI